MAKQREIRGEFGVHPAADLFPLLDGPEFEALKRDIEEHGQRVPIVMFGGAVLDGRNRMRACVELGIEPKFEDLDVDADPWSFVVSLNIYRRHLTLDQKRVIRGRAALEMGPVAEPGSNQHGGVSNRKQLAPSLTERAERFGISKGEMSKSIKAAETLATLPPALQAAVKTAEKTLKQAVREVAEAASEDAGEAEPDHGAIGKTPRMFKDVEAAISDLYEALTRFYDRWPPDQRIDMASTLRLFLGSALAKESRKLKEGSNGRQD